MAFQTMHKELALGMQAAAHSGVLKVTYCYCSIFDDCWIKSSAPPGEDQPNQATDQCPDFGADSFTN
jgi:hypothetical protein